MKKILFIILFLISFKTTLAQSSGVTIETSPLYPEPGERMSVEVSSYTVNLSESFISWYAKGQTLKEGEGVTSINFITPNERIRITAQIITPDNQEIVTFVDISASSVDLLWEAPNSYTPPFYKGKALPGPESLVKFTAIPTSENSINSSQNSQFYWEHNQEENSRNNGRGKASFSFILSPLRNQETVSVRSITSGRTATAETTISFFPMSVSVYPLSSGGEPFILRSLRNGDVINREITFFSAPYGASPKYLDNRTISFSWKINSAQVSPNSRPFIATITPGSLVEQSLGVGNEIIDSLFDKVSRVFSIRI